MLPPVSKLIQTLAHDSTTFGGGSAENGTMVRTDGHIYHTFAFKNTTDVTVTITFRGGEDSTPTDAWTITGSITLTPGNSTAQYGYETISDAWTYVGAVYTPSGNPTTGSVKMWHYAKG